MLPSRLIIFLRSALFVALLCIVGCQTAPPVQEMSDARQAITAAKEAGAEEHATEALAAAVVFLESAEKSISSKSYAQARRDALQAKAKAHDAIRLSEVGRDQSP
jgi:F0F1-type ATP synthase membrane subunit b/b'